MNTLIGIKDFRQSLAEIADSVAKGASFLVMRRSKPAFLVKPFEQEEVDEKLDLPGWNTIIDFTEGGKKKGISAKKLYKVMKKFIEKNE